MHLGTGEVGAVVVAARTSLDPTSSTGKVGCLAVGRRVTRARFHSVSQYVGIIFYDTLKHISLYGCVR